MYSNICIITSLILTDKKVGEKNSFIFLFSRVTDGRRRARHNVTIRYSLLRNLYNIIYHWLYQTVFFFYQYRLIIYTSLCPSAHWSRIFSKTLEIIIKAPNVRRCCNMFTNRLKLIVNSK